MCVDHEYSVMNSYISNHVRDSILFINNSTMSALYFTIVILKHTHEHGLFTLVYMTCIKGESRKPNYLAKV